MKRKYSITELEKIRRVLSDHYNKANTEETNLFFTRNRTEEQEKEKDRIGKVAANLRTVIEKIDEAFDKAVQDFLDEEIEIDYEYPDAD